MNTPSKEVLDQLAHEFDALRDQIRADLGERDANYIRKVIRQQRTMEVIGRVLLQFSFTPIGLSAGVAALSVAKIMENMELGHNIMHGQYDWMNDTCIHSTTWEWDTVCDAASWKRTHNYEHHTYTNIVGKDRDYGYALLRLSNDTPWHPMYRIQLVYYFLLSVLFQWGVGLHELEFEKIRRGEITLKDKKPFLKEFFRKSGKQVFKDYVLFPLLAGPFFLKVLLGNMLANLTRNLWASTIIFCGHFTESAETFTEEECANESRGHWYFRQLRGSSNFEGGKLLHMMSGHLSYQIEHHLFPDIPAWRYPEMSVKVREICERHQLPYNTGGFFDQYKTVLRRVLAFSTPPKPEALLS
ncbi:Fatty acid desaturase [gamma proteobacterium HdN1]|nr:Fatty acid desaturase [gamma proteobacterium HdN1]